MRYFTTPSVAAARGSVAWSLLFIFLLYFTAPALATFTKLQVLAYLFLVRGNKSHYSFGSLRFQHINRPFLQLE